MTKRAGRSVSNDPGFQASLQAHAGAICLVAKAWDYHVRVALGISNEENLEGVAQSVEAGRERAARPCSIASISSTATRPTAPMRWPCATAAHEAGARWVVLCDTNGGTLPHEVARDRRRTSRKHVPGSHLGIHTHNDTENAVANTLAAVRAGARQIQGTLNGLGERCGNANLASIIPTLLLKSDFADRFETGVTPERLAQADACQPAARRNPEPGAQPAGALCGESAFATKAGIHACAILKEPQTYEHVPPESGRQPAPVLVSNQAGKSNLRRRAGAARASRVDRDDPRRRRSSSTR